MNLTQRNSAFVTSQSASHNSGFLVIGGTMSAFVSAIVIVIALSPAAVTMMMGG